MTASGPANGGARVGKIAGGHSASTSGGHGAIRYLGIRSCRGSGGKGALGSRVAEIPAAAEVPFAGAERAEFRGETASALAAYQSRLQGDNEPAVLAGALLRGARIHWREGRWDEALRAFDRLSQISEAGIEGLPADFVARRARCHVLLDAGRNPELKREAEALWTDMLANRWSLDRSSWEMAAAQIAEWSGHPMAVPEWRRTLSKVASWAWEKRGDSRERVAFLNGQVVTLVWGPETSSTTVIAIPADFVDRWLEQTAAPIASRVGAMTESGWHVAGPKLVEGPGIVKISTAETGLPWVLAAGANPSSEPDPELAGRRRLLSFGLGAIVLLIAGAGYLLWRAVQRELMLVRLQTDFVAAVSHEFRTPLASLRPVTELLSEDDELPKERRSSSPPLWMSGLPSSAIPLRTCCSAANFLVGGSSSVANDLSAEHPQLVDLILDGSFRPAGLGEVAEFSVGLRVEF